MAHRFTRASLAGALLVLAGCVVAEPVYVQTPPPAPAAQLEVVPAPPGPAYVWVPGYWAWRGPHRGYLWVPGHYTVPAGPGYVWAPGHWAPGPRGHIWIEGHWRLR